MRFCSVLVMCAFAVAGCAAPSTTVLLSAGDQGYAAGAPVSPRPGTGQVMYLTGSDVRSIDRDDLMADSLLLDDRGGLIDLAFRGAEELVVLGTDAVWLYYAGKLFHGWDIAASADARIAASEDEIYVCTRDASGGTVLRLDPWEDRFVAVASFDAPIADIAIAPEGCFLVMEDAVWRLVVGEDGRGELLLVLAVPDARLESVAADLDAEIVYAASSRQTWAWRDGVAGPLHPAGGRLRCDGGTLFISSRAEGRLIRLDKADSLASDLE